LCAKFIDNSIIAIVLTVTIKIIYYVINFLVQLSTDINSKSF